MLPILSVWGKVMSRRVNEQTSKQVACEERQSNKVSGQVNKWTSEQVACEERQSNIVSGQVNEQTSEQVACIKDKVTQ